jgi:hypothetical protein
MYKVSKQSSPLLSKKKAEQLAQLWIPAVNIRQL